MKQTKMNLPLQLDRTENKQSKMNLPRLLHRMENKQTKMNNKGTKYAGSDGDVDVDVCGSK